MMCCWSRPHLGQKRLSCDTCTLQHMFGLFFMAPSYCSHWGWWCVPDPNDGRARHSCWGGPGFDLRCGRPPHWLGGVSINGTGWDRSHGLPALSRMWQHVKLSDVSLGTGSRYSLVVDEDFEKPNKETKTQMKVGDVETSARAALASPWLNSLSTAVYMIHCDLPREQTENDKSSDQVSLKLIMVKQNLTRAKKATCSALCVFRLRRPSTTCKGSIATVVVCRCQGQGKWDLPSLTLSR